MENVKTVRVRLIKTENPFHVSTICFDINRVINYYRRLFAVKFRVEPAERLERNEMDWS